MSEIHVIFSHLMPYTYDTDEKSLNIEKILEVYRDYDKAKERVRQLADDYVSKNGGDIGYGRTGGYFAMIFGRGREPITFRIKSMTFSD